MIDLAKQAVPPLFLLELIRLGLSHEPVPRRARACYLFDMRRREFITLLAGCRRSHKRRAAIGPAIGHRKDDHRMGRNYLAHSTRDAINAVLATTFAASSPGSAPYCSES
jgi:hypothetical protein